MTSWSSLSATSLPEVMAVVSSSLTICRCLRLLSSLSPRLGFFAHGVFSRTPTRDLSFSAVGNGRRYLSPCAAPEDVTGEVFEDSKFVPLNEDDPIYGPPVLLLAGFDLNEKPQIDQFLNDLEGDFMKIIYCTQDMLSLTVWDAVHVQQQNLKAMRFETSLPRVCIFSGLSGEEIMMFIEAFPETGLAPAVFAAMVPNSAGKLLGEVIDEIIGDHEMMSSTQSSV